MSIFKEQININAPGKSKFDLSHEKKLTLDMGRLVPILVQEVLPGDSFNVNTELLIRVAPMLAPIFHRIDVFTHFFYCPNRILWNEWEAFITGGADGLQAPVHPTLQFSNTLIATGSLMDYMGLPSDDQNNVTSLDVNALPFRAYQEIYNEYYRDENLIAKQAFSKNSGVILTGSAEFVQLVELKKRAWEKDYFTTALPFAQKGNPAAAPVDYSSGLPSTVNNSADGTPLANVGGLTTNAQGQLIATPPGAGSRIETEASVLITELRKAARLQEFLEAAARGGHRLTEWILHVFGVKSSDARLQRPEYLGGGKTPLTISEVLSNFQFSGDVEGKPQGNMAGHGVAYGDTHGFNRTFEEHGFIIGIMSVMPKANYFQGIERMWHRPSRFDYYIPQFAHLGEQEVTGREIYFDNTVADIAGSNAQTFGYQSRYADYKFKLSTIHGEFRETLAYWHMARQFSGAPGLNQSFIECNPPKDIFAVPTEPILMCQVYNEVSAIRPLPYFSNPKL